MGFLRTAGTPEAPRTVSLRLQVAALRKSTRTLAALSPDSQAEAIENEKG
jgi:hypothetical protein